jgi:predicted transcriptional regulator
MTEEKRSIIEHGILDNIEKHQGRVTQTELSSNLRVSIGLVNSYIKRLVQKGFIKVSNVRANTVKYMLTQEGFKEKYRLVRRYMSNSLSYYKKIKIAVEERIVRLKLEEVRTVVFIGSSEISEIMHLYLGNTKIKLQGVFDLNSSDKLFFNHKVLSIEKLPKFIKTKNVDKVLINYFKDVEEIESKLLSMGIKKELIESKW